MTPTTPLTPLTVRYPVKHFRDKLTQVVLTSEVRAAQKAAA